MKKALFAAILSAALLINSAGSAAAVWVWTPDTKKWRNPKHAPRDTPKAQFEAAMSFFNAADYKKALREFRRLIKNYPDSEYAPEGQYYIALCLDNQEAYYEAFKAYQKVIEAYPYNERVDRIIENQYVIGKRFYDGYKSKLLGVAFLPSTDKATEVFLKITENAPYGKYADDAQYYLGLSYKKERKFKEAKEAFAKLLDEYPDSELAADAKFQIGLASAEAAPEAAYDQQRTEESIKEFKEFLEANPEAKKADEATEVLNRQKEKKAESLFEVAVFYEKLKKYKSAELYYNQVINDYSGTGWASKSAEKLQILTEKGRL